LNAAMSKDESFSTNYTYLKANEKDPMSKSVDFIFLSFDRNLEGEECEQLAQEYFETHNKMTLPGQPLIVDLRPAFRNRYRKSLQKFPLIEATSIDVA
jgi:hypothetical protein